MRFALRTKILLLVAGTVMGLAALIIFAMTTLTGQEVNRAIHDSVLTTDDVLSQFLHERSDRMREEARLLVLPSTTLKQYIQSPDHAPDQATIRDIAESLRQQMRADSAIITDRDGRSLGETDPAAPFLADRMTDPGVASAVDNKAWTGIVIRSGQLTLQASVPVAIGPEVWGTFTAYSTVDAGDCQTSENGVGRQRSRFCGTGSCHGRVPASAGHPPDAAK